MLLASMGGGNSNRELGVEERTLRRAASQGTLRCRRLGPRRLRFATGEHDYPRSHWQMLAALRQALRTERRVRLAVLYGSAARGDDEGRVLIDRDGAWSQLRERRRAIRARAQRAYRRQVTDAQRAIAELSA